MLDIIAESERIAVFRDETYRGLKGPGVVVRLPLPGAKSVKLRIGDRGLLISSNTARFKNVVVPVVLDGPTTRTDVAIKDFTESLIIVTGNVESVSAPAPCDEEASHEPTKGRLSLPNFVAGLLVMLLLTGAGWGAAYYAYSRLSIKRAVYRDGIRTVGRVLHKTSSSPSNRSTVQLYLTYAFEAPNGRITNEVEVDEVLWSRSKEGAPIAVRYLPDTPEMNLPEGVHFADRYLLACLFSSVVGLLSTIVIVGMIANRLRPAPRVRSRRPS